MSKPGHAGDVYDDPRKRALSLLKNEVPFDEIARRIGWSADQVRALAQEESLTSKGGSQRGPKDFVTSYGKPGGDLETALRSLPKPIAGWLAKITPAGCTVAETLVALATDTYHEEKGE